MISRASELCLKGRVSAIKLVEDASQRIDVDGGIVTRAGVGLKPLQHFGCRVCRRGTAKSVDVDGKGKVRFNELGTAHIDQADVKIAARHLLLERDAIVTQHDVAHGEVAVDKGRVERLRGQDDLEHAQTQRGDDITGAGFSAITQGWPCIKKRDAVNPFHKQRRGSVCRVAKTVDIGKTP